MLSSVHLISGGFTAVTLAHLVPTPYLYPAAVIGCFVLHFALDMIPHFSPASLKQASNRKLAAIAVSDMMVALVIVGGLFTPVLSNPLFWIGAVASILPDVIWGIQKVLLSPKRFIENWYVRLHNKIHWFEDNPRLCSLTPEVLAIIMMILAAHSYLNPTIIQALNLLP